MIATGPVAAMGATAKGTTVRRGPTASPAQQLERVLGANALFATAYGNVGSSIYYALGLSGLSRSA